ncbi:hypothetical protein ACFL2D_02010 [Patescibacteria group bacterium]
MYKFLTETQSSFCDGIQDLIDSGESVRFFAPLEEGNKIKDFEASGETHCTGLHVGINEAGRQGLICFYFVEFNKEDESDFQSGIVLLSLIRDRDQLSTLFNPTKLAALLRCDHNIASKIVDHLKKDFLSYQRLKLMYGIYQLMQEREE